MLFIHCITRPLFHAHYKVRYHKITYIPVHIIIWVVARSCAWSSSTWTFTLMCTCIGTLCQSLSLCVQTIKHPHTEGVVSLSHCGSQGEFYGRATNSSKLYLETIKVFLSFNCSIHHVCYPTLYHHRLV